MTYVVNPDDGTTPLNSQGAKQGAEELRALKTKINTLAVANTSGASVRQAVQSAFLDVNGYNTALSAGAGLRVALAATAIPYQLSTATGFIGGKVSNNDESFLVDNADIIGADLPVSNTSYLYRQFGVAFKSTIIPPQYGYFFDRTRQALLNFEGLNGAVTTTDDFGNVWTLTGATLSTTQKQFGTSSLALSGAGQFANTNDIKSLGDGSWEISAWVRWAVLPTPATTQFIFGGENAAGFGFILGLNNAAGVTKLNILLSSTGAAFDIANSLLGANTVWVVNTWYKFRMVFDALAGTYRLYLSIAGGAETQDFTVASASKICVFQSLRIGLNSSASLATLNGFVDAFRFLPGATKTTTEVPAIVAPAVTDYPIDFFSIPVMKMFEVTAASAISGTNPTLTVVNNLFIGEADTSGVAITAVRNYAIKGEYISQDITPLPNINILISLNHNLGIRPRESRIFIRNLTSQSGYSPGDVIIPFTQDTAAPSFSAMEFACNRITMRTVTGASNHWLFNVLTTGAAGAATLAFWAYFAIARRGW